VIYLTGVSNPTIRAWASTRTDVGLMAQPRSAVLGHAADYSAGYAFDNGAFGAFLRGTPFDVPAWERQLAKLPDGLCRFVVVPDVVGNHDGTRASWDLHAGTVHTTGRPAAFVLQNGCTDLSQVPNNADAVFIGGDDTYKLGADAARVGWQARGHGLWVHMGRVNSASRFCRALAMGCDSADGTFLRFGPVQQQIDRVTAWLNTGRDSGGQLDLTERVA